MAPTRYQAKRDIQKEGETKTSVMNIKENSFFKLHEHAAVQRYSENPVEKRRETEDERSLLSFPQNGRRAGEEVGLAR